MAPTAIRKIDIGSFGLFKNYAWDSVIGRENFFHRLNIIYGRNYSGKTTLSRIFKSLEDNRVHPDYLPCEFKLSLSDGSVVTNETISTSLNDRLKVRVYNKDFVSTNLSWLHRDDGTIEPFTVLGAKNVLLEKEIDEIDITLGSEETKTGLHFDVAEKSMSYEETNKAYEKKRASIKDKLKNKAQEIKLNTKLFNQPVYLITHIENDIKVIQGKVIITDDQLEERKKLIREEPKIIINPLRENQPKFADYYSECKELLSCTIMMNESLTELVNDAILQEWVRDGISIHKGIRDTCGFCGNPINTSLWEKLDAHFNKESEELRKKLENQITVLNSAKKNLASFMPLSREMFYTRLVSKFDDLVKEWTTSLTNYSSNIDILIQLLQDRIVDIFKEKVVPIISDESPKVLDLIRRLNTLINENNAITTNLEKEQSIGYEEIRFKEIYEFLKNINYYSEIDELNELDKKRSTYKNLLKDAQRSVMDLMQLRRDKESQSKDESRGAELVNQHLNHFFGHNTIRLVAEGTSPKVRFKIVRETSTTISDGGGVYANNLSEGECSLISFCYFIARMQDELETEEPNNLIIYIDDPISSLDSNHIFFMFGLIEGIIAGPQKYAQLFISTHNLNFLKYLKLLTVPPREALFRNSKKCIALNHFLVERTSKVSTRLTLAPDYLKKYVTEFNYLFQQIYECAKASPNIREIEHQYNFGNNMRKFLEAYLFYKYPCHQRLDEKLSKFFGNDQVSMSLVNRVINEYSHLEEKFDRGLEPIDIDEIGRIANVVLETIKKTDPDQYEALLESIGVREPLPEVVSP